MDKIDLNKFKGLILTDGQNTLNAQLLKLTNEEYTLFSFKRLGNCFIEHIKTGDIYFAIPKNYLLTKLENNTNNNI